MSDIAALKKTARAYASAKRQTLISVEAAVLAMQHFLSMPQISQGKTVSLYWPMGSELDTRPLLQELARREISCLLPIVEKKDHPLIFKKWQSGDPLEKGGFGTLVPEQNAARGIPDILVVPLLAFDEAGYRLGYGGGFYDRTLEALRAQKSCLAVGFAYSGQQVDHVIIDQFDQRLDWIVTEKSARNIL